MNGMKYKLVRAGRRKAHYEDGRTHRYFRLQALRDIPEYGVKAGDFGGYITKEVQLSHYGSCWIGGEAHVIGRVEVKDNAYINGQATVSCNMHISKIIVSENAKVLHKARVITYTTDAGTDSCIVTEIKGSAEIAGEAWCKSVIEVSGETKIYDKAVVEYNSKVRASSEISGSVKVGADCLIENSIIKDRAVIGNKCSLTDTLATGNAIVSDQCMLRQTELTGNAIVPLGERLTNGQIDKTGIKAVAPFKETPSIILEIDPEDPFQVNSPALPADYNPVIKVSPVSEEFIALLNEVKGNIASYETDIVKLIKYPAMVDQSIPETLAMTVALKKAMRLSGRPASKEFRDAVETLEQKFIVAESNAIKMAATILSEEGLKKTRKAKDLLQVASNEAATENEKKVAFIQGFKQLEGVIAVPEVAKDTFRVKIGLQELEMLDSVGMESEN